MARYAIKTILFSSSVDIRSVLQPSLQLGKTLDMTCGILHLLPSLLNDEEKSVETWDGKGHKALMLSGLFTSVPPYILTKKNKLLFCYLIEVLCCILTLSPVNIKIIKLHLCQRQIKSWVNMYCCQGAMSRSSVPQKDEHSKTSPRWGSEKSQLLPFVQVQMFTEDWPVCAKTINYSFLLSDYSLSMLPYEDILVRLPKPAFLFSLYVKINILRF